MGLVQVHVERLGVDGSNDTPVVVLRERDGDRSLPIWIGPGEANAIALHLAGMKLPRPLTHDLLAAVIRDHDSTLEEIVIDHMLDNMYISELRIRRGPDRITTDARPSDAIALGLRLGATMLVDERLLKSETIELQAFGGRRPPVGAEDEEPLDEE